MHKETSRISLPDWAYAIDVVKVKHVARIAVARAERKSQAVPKPARG